MVLHGSPMIIKMLLLFCKACTRCDLRISHLQPRNGSRAAQACHDTSNQRQHVAFPTCISSSSFLLSPHHPGSPPSSSTDLCFPPNSQISWIVTDQELLAEDLQIAHIRPADIKTRNRHRPTLYMLCAALTNCPEVWTDKEI